MDENNSIQLFEDRKIRTAWDEEIDRALETYQKKGYDADWIHQRILSIRVRNELTAEWQARGVQQGKEYAILTDEITKAWSGMTTRQYKNLKGLKKENLRDNMSTTEIILNMLAETSTKQGSDEHRFLQRRLRREVFALIHNRKAPSWK